MLSKIDELQYRVSDVSLGKEDAADLEKAIRQELQSAGTDQEMAVRLRLLLGEVYSWAKEPAKARAQYRKVLAQDPGSTEAMIAIGHSFHATRRFSKAREWFQAAYSASEGRQDHAGQLAALDHLAFNADLRGDTHGLSTTLDQMCRFVTSAPRMDWVHAMIAEWLIVAGKGALALPYLECLVKHTLELGYPRPFLLFALRPYVGVLRQQGRTYDEISAEIARLRPLAVDDGTAANFDIVTEWAFSHCRGFYEMVFRDLQAKAER